MITICPFSTLNELWEYSYLEKNSSVKFITPHPQVLSGLRGQIGEKRRDLQAQYVTIFEFIKTSLEKDSINIYEKNKLMLELSVVWKKLFSSTEDQRAFFHSFDLFRDFRGISVDFSLIEEGLVNCNWLEKDTAGAIKIFWQYLTERNIYDEHSACHLLTEKYNNAPFSIAPQKLVFYGFSHLTPLQCFLLESMGKIHSIYVPFPLSVYKDARDSDWIKWIGGEVLPVEEKNTKANLKVAVVRERGMGPGIKFVLEKHLQEEGEILLGEKNPTLGQVGEIPLGQIFFQVEASLFSNTYQKVFNQLIQLWSNTHTVDTQRIVEYLRSMEKEALSEDLPQKDFKLIKTIRLIQQEIDDWCSLSDLNKKATIFDYTVWQQAFTSNLPRNFITPSLSQESEISVMGLERIHSLHMGRGVVVGVSSKYTFQSSSKGKLRQEIMEFVCAVGAVPRQELEEELLREHIMMILQREKSFLVIEKEVQERDDFWYEILRHFCIEKIVVEEALPQNKIDFVARWPKKNYLAQQEKWSAGRIQQFIDCRRAFYYKYVENIPYSPPSKNKIDKGQRGNLQHWVIAKYLERFEQFSSARHHTIVEEEINSFICDQGLLLDKLEYEKAFIEVKNYSANGIHFLLDFKKEFPSSEFVFEKKFENDEHRGSVDCIITFNDGLGVIDFKRNTAPSVKDIMEFRKIQLWYYLHHITNPKDKVYFFAYLRLSKIKDSRVTLNNDFSTNSLKSFFPQRTSTHETSFKEKMGDFARDLIERIEDIPQEEEFRPIPQNQNVCRYCWLDNICIKDNL